MAFRLLTDDNKCIIGFSGWSVNNEKQGKYGKAGKEQQDAGSDVQHFCFQKIRKEKAGLPVPGGVRMEAGTGVFVVVIRKGEGEEVFQTFLLGPADGLRGELRTAVGGGQDPDDLRRGIFLANQADRVSTKASSVPATASSA
jgi:hypothetical protein